MNKLYTLFYSVKSVECESKIIIINSNNLSLNKVYKKTSELLSSIRLCPGEEVINNILKHADS